MVQEKLIYHERVEYNQRWKFDDFVDKLPGAKLAIHKSHDPSCKGQYQKAWHVNGVTVVCDYQYKDFGLEQVNLVKITAIGNPKPISELEKILIKNARKILTKPLELKGIR